MGPAAEALKDKVQTGLAQSLKGRAFARADVLDQAAAETGDTGLSDLANTLRNQNFAEIAATQTALEFKRQKMPANIEKMLGIQQGLKALQQQDGVNNQTTATQTTKMANFLTGGGFSSAIAALANPMTAGQMGTGVAAAQQGQEAAALNAFKASVDKAREAEKQLNTSIALGEEQAVKGFGTRTGKENTQDQVKQNRQALIDAKVNQLKAYDAMSGDQRKAADEADPELAAKMAAIRNNIIPGGDLTKLSTSIGKANEALPKIGAGRVLDPGAYQNVMEDNGDRLNQIGSYAVPQNDSWHGLTESRVDAPIEPMSENMKKLIDAEKAGATNWRNAAEEDYVQEGGTPPAAPSSGTPGAPAAAPTMTPIVATHPAPVGATEGLVSVQPVGPPPTTEGLPPQTITAEVPIEVTINIDNIPQIASLTRRVDLVEGRTQNIPASEAGAPVAVDNMA
jgi:hypothetical protein